MALVFCALLMYTLSWNKPFGVECRLPIHAKYGHSISATIQAIKQSGSEDRAVTTLMKDGPAIAKSTKEYLTLYFQKLLLERPSTHNPAIGFPEGDIPCLDELGNLIIALEDTDIFDLHFFGRMPRDVSKNLCGVPCTFYVPRDFTISLIFHLTGTLFSAFHIGAWDWKFPTPTIRTV